MKKDWRIALVPVTVVSIAIAYFVYDYSKKTSCEGIFQQTDLKLKADLEAIKLKGGLYLGSEKIQDLTERSQITAVNLKGCCIAADKGLIEQGEFLECKTQAGVYETQVRQIVTVVTAAEEAQRNDQSTVVQAKLAEVDALLNSAESTAERLKDIVKDDTETSDAAPRPPKTVSATSAEKEPNNDFFTATPINFRDTVTAEINATDDQDVFKVNNSSKLRDWMKVSFRNRSMTLAPDVFLHNEKKVQLSEQYNGTPGADLDVYFVAEVGQDYYIRVPFYKGVGEYTLMIEPTEAYDKHEPNDNARLATTVRLGKELSAGILDNRDVDWYTFSSATSKKIRVDFKNHSDKLAPDVFLYDHNKAQLSENYNGTPGAEVSFYFDAEGGKGYYLKVPFYKGAGEYSLKIE